MLGLVEKTGRERRAWKVKETDILKYDQDGNVLSVNLDWKNPRKKEDITHLTPEQLAESILEKERRIEDIVADIKRLLEKQSA